MKSTLVASLLALGTALASLAESPWLTDFEAAKKVAAQEKKLLLLDFTGSDWCSWCIKMKKETLDQAAFKDYAKTNLVLVEVDFPQRKKLPAAIAKQNDGLQGKYKVDGFPCYVLLDASGKEIGRQPGYLKGGPEAFIRKLDSFKARAGK